MKQKPGVGVGVMILRGNKVLLGKRHSDPTKADSELHGEGSWTMPGGKLEFQEELKEAAIREVMEETGIKVMNFELISVSNDKIPDKHFVTIGFLAENFEGEPRVMEPDEITEWQWFDLNNLPHPIFLPSEKILKNYLAGKIYQED
ncbi:MAG: ADP-ribose pyrophosphatase [Candidatus Nealsonbacteria bacterium CG_4_10_14_0_2_um_filter_38_17]|uniref:ADP-ribose pyrophosphatase n=1 Tax=Candidatus Nealsonbacteria bacterium CG_4_10_14_0_2_um_filter_38_17 TaxID=1974680 RepID=A0A2M7UXK5_9BACT|nr:MAG: ADP-ribose pyrophosphatase [Candidatus Nealsonbacteria bacterium CG_4_10_14_0_2_um_filter_38_17]